MLRNTRTSMGEIWDRTGVGKSLAQVIKSLVNIWLIVFVTQHIIFQDDYQKWRWMKHKSRPYAEFLAVGEAYKAKLWPTPGFKERTFDSCGFSAKGFLISASVIPQWYTTEERMGNIFTTSFLTYIYFHLWSDQNSHCWHLLGKLRRR